MTTLDEIKAAIRELANSDSLPLLDKHDALADISELADELLLHLPDVDSEGSDPADAENETLTPAEEDEQEDPKQKPAVALAAKPRPLYHDESGDDLQLPEGIDLNNPLAPANGRSIDANKNNE